MNFEHRVNFAEKVLVHDDGFNLGLELLEKVVCRLIFELKAEVVEIVVENVREIIFLIFNSNKRLLLIPDNLFLGWFLGNVFNNFNFDLVIIGRTGFLHFSQLRGQIFEENQPKITLTPYTLFKLSRSKKKDQSVD